MGIEAQSFFSFLAPFNVSVVARHDVLTIRSRVNKIWEAHFGLASRVREAKRCDEEAPLPENKREARVESFACDDTENLFS